MAKRVKVTLVTFVLVGGLAAGAGCGGGGGGDSDRLSREELISQADAICVKALKDAAALGLPQSIEEVGEFAAGLKPIFEEVLSELRGLEPPEDLEDEYDELISSNEESLDLLDELAEAGAQGDTVRFEELAQEAEQTDQEDERLARAIGLRDCEQYEIFEGDGYSFAYPEAWGESEGELRVLTEGCSPPVYFGPQDGSDVLAIGVCPLRLSVTAENIDELSGQLAAEVDQSLRQAQGRITKGPTRLTVDGLPALRFEASALDPDGVRVPSQLFFVFDGRTEYWLNCQYTPEGAEEMKRGCDEVVDSFHVE